VQGDERAQLATVSIGSWAEIDVDLEGVVGVGHVLSGSRTATPNGPGDRPGTALPAAFGRRLLRHGGGAARAVPVDGAGVRAARPAGTAATIDGSDIAVRVPSPGWSRRRTGLPLRRIEGRCRVDVRRVTINGRAFALVDPESAARMLRDIETAARTGPAWVTIPVRESHPPQVLITSHTDCFLEVLDIPDEDPQVPGAALAFATDWPSFEP
jgi:hypothetical protein